MFCWWLKEKRSELIHVFTKREKLAVSPLGGWGEVGGVWGGEGWGCGRECDVVGLLFVVCTVSF